MLYHLMPSEVSKWLGWFSTLYLDDISTVIQALSNHTKISTSKKFNNNNPGKLRPEDRTFLGSNSQCLLCHATVCPLRPEWGYPSFSLSRESDCLRRQQISLGNWFTATLPANGICKMRQEFWSDSRLRSKAASWENGVMHAGCVRYGRKWNW
jgi:hypothetical protein